MKQSKDRILTIAISTIGDRIKDIDPDFFYSHPLVEYLILHQNVKTEHEQTIEQLTRLINVRYVSIPTLGLSNSRNSALSNSTTKFTSFCDDDLKLNNSTLNSLLEILQRIEADVYLTRLSDKKNVLPEGYLTTKKNILEFWSPEIIIATKSVSKKIIFNPDFGAGTAIPIGEETIFLNECLKHGMKFFYTGLPLFSLKENFHSLHRFESKKLLFYQFIVHREIYDSAERIVIFFKLIVYNILGINKQNRLKDIVESFISAAFFKLSSEE